MFEDSCGVGTRNAAVSLHVAMDVAQNKVVEAVAIWFMGGVGLTSMKLYEIILRGRLKPQWLFS